MENQNTNLFKNGATWLRADFHLHTIKEKCPSRAKLRDEWKGQEDEFSAAFVDQLAKQDIRIACITNHDFLDVEEYKKIAKKGRKKDILILPGIELNVQGGKTGIHTLVIFNPDQVRSDNTSINDFCRSQCPNCSATDYITDDGLPKILDGLEKLEIDYFIVFAHVNSENGLLKELKGPNLQALYRSSKNLWNKRVLGFQKLKTTDQNALQNILGEIRIPAQVEGSDPIDSINDINNGERKSCFLKLSDLSYESVKFALRDRLEDQDRNTFPRVSSELPATSATAHILSVSIHSSTKKHLFHYDFSRQLNTMVGSRGAGKSLVIEALRWGLEKQPVADSDYKNGLIHTFLDKGGSVEIHAISHHGQPIQIKRTYLGKRDQSPAEVSISGDVSNVSITTLLPSLLYFGQKDLGERSENSSDSALFEQILGRTSSEITDEIQAKKDSLTELAQQYLTAKKAKSEDAEYAYELKTLKQKLLTFKEKGIEEKMKEITDFDSDLSRFRNFYKSLIENKPDYDEAQSLFTSILTDAPELKSPINKELQGELSKLKDKAKELESELENINAGITTLTDQYKEIGLKLKQKKEALQARFAEILQSVDEPDLDIDSYRTIVTRVAQLERLRKLTLEGISAEDRIKREILNAGKDYLALHENLSSTQQKRLEEISTNLPTSLKLGTNFAGSEDHYTDYLNEMFKGKGFQQTALQKLVEQTSSGVELFKRLDTLCESELTPKMAEKLKATLDEKLPSLITYIAPDKRFISYNDKQIEHLSLGKRAMALLLLLLSLDEYSIIIIDQPEDDLDNETIHNMVVQPLHERKRNTQFIIATHNPNIPVLADAEQVIACKETARDEYQHDSGSIDKPSTKSDIITIMEGGAKAFERRNTIYTSWTS